MTLIDKLIFFSTFFTKPASKNILLTISHISGLADAASHDEYSKTTDKIKSYLYRLLTKDYSLLISNDKFSELIKILSWKNLQNSSYMIESAVREALKNIALEDQQKILQNLGRYYETYQIYGMLKIYLYF